MSLYPTVNKYDEYPLGHPIYHPTPGGLSAAQLVEFFGIAEVSVLPPTDLQLPLLPYRVNKKLLFGLCRVCMEEHAAAADDDAAASAAAAGGECLHNDSQRSLRGTWCILELAKAFQLGYRLLHVHGLAYWPEHRSGLFAQYVDTFLKLKASASGSAGMTAAEQTAYIDAFYEQEGIRLDRVEENPGLRFVAKIFLNS